MGGREPMLDHAQLMRMVERLGGEVRDGGRHFVIRSEGRVIAILPKGRAANKPGRGYLNMRGQLRRAGLWDTRLAR